MQAALHAILFVSLLTLGGCDTSVVQASTPLPDARDLSENPLDVTKLPQP
jgi:hypothetical protein